jgi:ABC-type dipeptide/oligopeptide/nickel transport system permease subunit
VALAVWLLPPRVHERPTPLQPMGADVLRKLRGDRLFLLAVSLITMWIVVGVIGPHIAPYSAQDFNVGHRNEGPSWSHLFGTDRIGRDEFSVALRGLNTSLRFASAAFFGGFVPGVVFAIFAARARWLRWFVVELGGAWRALPWLLVLFAVTFPYGYGLKPLGVVLGVGAFLSATTLAPVFGGGRDRPIRERWRVGGARMVASGTSTVTLAILAEASMAFLGLRTAKISLGSEFANLWNNSLAPIAALSLIGGTLCLSLFAFNLLRARMLTLASAAAPLDDQNSAPP